MQYDKGFHPFLAVKSFCLVRVRVPTGETQRLLNQTNFLVSVDGRQDISSSILQWSPSCDKNCLARQPAHNSSCTLPPASRSASALYPQFSTKGRPALCLW